MGADKGVELRHPQGDSRATPGVGGTRKGEEIPGYISRSDARGVGPLGLRYIRCRDVLLCRQLTCAEASVLCFVFGGRRRTI